MMCKKHNRWFRVGERCSLCEGERKEREELERAIFIAELENLEPIVLWERI